MYRRLFAIVEGDPRMGTESFCVLPASKDGRFIVLSHQHEGPSPSSERIGTAAWKAFLRDVRLLTVKKKAGRKS